MSEREKPVMISLRIPISMLKRLDSLVDAGLYVSRSEAIREAVRRLLNAGQGKG